MNFGQLKEELALELRDPDKTHFTDSILGTIINRGERRICQRADCLASWVTSGLTLVQDQRLYTISSFFTGYDVIKIKKILLDNNELYPREEVYFLEEYGQDWRDLDSSDSGTPEHWHMTSKSKQFGVYPPPDSDNLSPVNCLIIHFPTTTMSNDSDTPEIPVNFHDNIIDFGLYEGLRIDREWEDAGQAWAQFRRRLDESISDSKSDISIDKRPLYAG